MIYYVSPCSASNALQVTLIEFRFQLKRSTSIMRRTQLLLKRLVRLTVETGLITGALKLQLNHLFRAH